MRLNAGEFANITNNLDQQLLAFARKDFDRTTCDCSNAGRSMRVRLSICLTLLNKILVAEKLESRTSDRIEDSDSEIRRRAARLE